MRFVLTSCLMYICFGSLWSQERDFSTVDATAIFYSDQLRTTQEVSDQIKKDFSEPLDQLRAAYTWIIHNIAYDPEEYKTYQFQYRILAERDEKLVSTREEIISRTIYGKRAVCEGYALALERICEELGINSYVVRGDVKRDVVDIGRSFEKNHMWIIAIIQDKPIIMDPTWGAGRYLDGFKKEPSYAFYNVDPKHFIKSHYPAVFDDAYIDGSISKTTFASWPLIVPETLELEDLNTQSGLIKSKDLKKGIDFTIAFQPKETLIYTFDDGIQREVKGTTKGEKVSFSIRSNAKTSRLILYDGSQPLVAYLVK